MFEGMYRPLSTEEENRVISISVNTICMQKNMDAILSDIQSLSEITDRTSAFNTFDADVYDLYERRKAERKCDDDPSRASLF